MSYRYVKAPPGYTLAKPVSFGRRLRFGASLLFLTLGTATFTTVAYPLLSYQLDYAPRFQKGETVSPVPTSPVIATTTTNPIIKQVKAADNPTFASEVVNTSLDYTDASSWFVGATKTQNPNLPYLTYTIAIPKLGITSALVHTNNTDLKKSLIQYSGTAMPGDLGNTVIFGHSVLPQFFNPQNYLTIFSTLYLLHLGDNIQVTADGATYTYKIVDMYEVQPDDLTPLAQTYDSSYLTLITCTPSGTFLRRLIVKAQIV
jgi:sortase A